MTQTIKCPAGEEQQLLCTKCGVEKPESEFSLAPEKKRGRAFWCKGCHRDRAAERGEELKIETLQQYGGSCACCGEDGLAFLTIDHIEGGGNKEREKVSGGMGGTKFYRWLKKEGWPEGYQVLCYNCNAATTGGATCPHKLEVMVNG